MKARDRAEISLPFQMNIVPRRTPWPRQSRRSAHSATSLVGRHIVVLGDESLDLGLDYGAVERVVREHEL